MTGVIYALAHPETGEVRYVGKTSGDPQKRLREHLAGARRGIIRHRPLYSWLRGLQGRTPDLLILARDPVDLNESERGWIAQYRASGARLCNVLDGGDGWTPGRPQSADSNRKRSETLRLRGPSESQLQGLSLAREAARTPEVRARAAASISRAMKGRIPCNKRVWTPELREEALALYARMSAEDVARALGIGRRQMFEFLRTEGVIRARHDRAPKTPGH